MKLTAGQVFRCSNPSCDCEIALREPPRHSGRPDAAAIPACCFCGTPMGLKA